MTQSWFRVALDDEATDNLSRLAEKYCGNLPRHRMLQIKRGVMSDLLHIIVHFALNDENCLENVAPDETSEYAAPDETAANAAPPGLNDIIDLARKLTI